MELKHFKQLPAFPKDPPAPPPQVKAREFFKGLTKAVQPLKGGRELIAGGEIKWKPVNREAAKLLAKSSHIHHPPTNPMSKNDLKARSIANPGDEFGRTIVDDPTNAAVQVGNMLQKKAEGTPSKIRQFAEDTAIARKMLDDATDNVRLTMVEFVDNLPKLTEKVRQWRMMIERETKMSLDSLRELRQFFLEDAHEKEILRLSEFVRLCERLKMLVDDGTMEKITDVMLKLAIKP